MNKLQTAISALYAYDDDADSLDPVENFFKSLQVSTNFKDYIGNANDWDLIVKDAFGGERGKNFIGNYKKVLEAQEFLGY